MEQLECYYSIYIENNDVIDSIAFFQYEIISFWLNVASHSLTMLNPSLFERLINWFLVCFCNLRLRVLNKSSTGAHSGEYGTRNMIFHPKVSRASIDFLDLWIDQLSSMITILFGSNLASFWIHSLSFQTNSIKLEELFLLVRFTANQFPSEVIAKMSDIELWKHMLLRFQLIPLSSHE